MTLDILNGKKPIGSPAEIQYVREHILCYNYKMSPDDVRKMDNYDCMAHIQMCLAREESEKHADAKTSGSSTRSNANKYNTSGVKKTNIMNF